MKRSTGIAWPPITVWPTAGSSRRDSWPRASWPSHCSTKAVRSVRCGAFGQPWPNRMVRTVPSSSDSRTSPRSSNRPAESSHRQESDSAPCPPIRSRSTASPAATPPGAGRMLGSSPSPLPTTRAARPPSTRFLIRNRMASRWFRSPSSSCRSSFSQARPNQRVPVIRRRDLDVDALAELERSRLRQGDLDRQDAGVDRTAGVRRAGATAHHGIGDLLDRAVPLRWAVPLRRDRDRRPQCDSCGVELVDLGLDPEPVQVGDRDDRSSPARRSRRAGRAAP